MLLSPDWCPGPALEARRSWAGALGEGSTLCSKVLEHLGVSLAHCDISTEGASTLQAQHLQAGLAAHCGGYGGKIEEAANGDRVEVDWNEVEATVYRRQRKRATM